MTNGERRLRAGSSLEKSGLCQIYMPKGGREAREEAFFVDGLSGKKARGEGGKPANMCLQGSSYTSPSFLPRAAADAFLRRQLIDRSILPLVNAM